jgi:hypothetical protein
MGIPRNELARIVGFGDIKNGGWLVQRVGESLFRPVLQQDPQSINTFSMQELTVLTGKQWMPVKDPDGTVRFRTRP